VTTSARVGLRISGIGLALALVAGCGATGVGGQADPTSTPQASSGGSGVMPSLDPCKLLTAQELQAAGVSSDPSPLNGGGEVGCQYAKDYSIGLSKSSESIDSYKSRAATFVKFSQHDINGRPGVQVQISKTNTECSQVLGVGSGDVVVSVGAYSNGDPCAEVEKLAQLVEPRLPK
jgi:hypothetical protein